MFFSGLMSQEEDTSDVHVDGTDMQERLAPADSDTTVTLSFELVMAAWNGDSAYTIRLLKEGADVNSVSYEGISALMYAAQNGHLSVVKILAANGADMDYKYPGVKPALIMAVLQNHFPVVRYLLHKGANINISDDGGNTALLYSSMYGNLAMTRLLLANKADPNMKNLNGESPLWLASYSGYQMIVYELLISDADINAANTTGYTSLMISAMYNDTSTLAYLLKNKADILKTNVYGHTAKDIAVIHSEWEAFKILSAYSKPEKAEVRMFCKSAVSNGNYDLLDSVKTISKAVYLLPYIGSMTIGYGFDAAMNDMMYSPFLVWHEKRYRTAIRMGWSARYWRNRVEFETGKGVFQLWERRNDFYAGIEKKIRVSKDKSINHSCHFGGVQANYSIIRYRGVSKSPSPELTFSPYIGYARTGKYGGYGLRYIYYPTGDSGLSPHRIGFYFTITLYNRSNDKYLVKCSTCY